LKRDKISPTPTILVNEAKQILGLQTNNLFHIDKWPPIFEKKRNTKEAKNQTQRVKTLCKSD